MRAPLSTSPPAPPRLVVAAFWAVMLALLALEVVRALMDPHAMGAPDAAGDAAFLVILAGSAGAVFVRGGFGGRRNHAALLLGAGMLFYFGGYLTVLIHGDREEPSAVAQGLWIVLYPCTLGVVALLSRGVLRWSAALALDAIIATLGLATAAWIALIAPAAGVAGVSDGQLAGAALYFAADIVILGAVAAVLARGSCAARRNLLGIGGAFVLIAGADAYYAHQVARDLPWLGGVLTCLWSGGILVLAWTAWQPAATSAPQERDQPMVAVPVLAALGVVLTALTPWGTVTNALSASIAIAVCLRLVISSRAQRRLLEVARGSARRYRSLVETTQSVVWAMDLDGRFTFVNDAVREVYGIGPEEMVGRSVLDFKPPELRPGGLDRLQRTFCGQQLNSYETDVVHADGRRVSLLVNAAPLVDERGHCIGATGTATDITDRKAAERELVESRDRLEAILSNSAAVIYLYDLEDRWLMANPAYETSLGLQPGDLIGRSMFDVFDEPVARQLAENNRAVAELRAPGRYEEHVTHSGGVRSFISLKFPLLDAHGVPYAVGGISTDITERVRIDAALRHSEERYRHIVETANEGIWVLDARGRTTFANRALAEMLGRSVEDLAGAEVTAFFSEDQRARALEALGGRERGVAAHHELTLTAADGGDVPCLLSTSPVFDDEGDFMGALAMVTDLRERVRAEQERERLKTELHHAQKMESVGQLAGGVAHDFNNLLGVILNYADFVDEGLEGRPDLRADVDQIRMAAERAASLTQQLLIVSRRDVARPQAVDPAEVVADTEKLLKRTLGEGIELETRLDPGVPPVLVDPGQLQQVLLNLVINGADAMEGKGRLTVAVQNAGGGVRISVADTGPGMAPEIAARVFEPFFTTKPAGKGSGLGLATAYGVIADAGGTIEVDAEHEGGARFEILLPATGRAVVTPASEEDDVVPRGHGETVLVVEDHDSVRSLAARILSAHGYQVVEASEPAAALESEAVNAGEVDLLLSDLVLPGMSGTDLAARVRRLMPDLKMLFMSGYTDDVMARHGIAQDSVAFLPKPFTAATLLRLVRETLDEGALCP